MVEGYVGICFSLMIEGFVVIVLALW